MNAIANMDIYKCNEDLLFGGDIVRAKGKKQQGLLSWVGCPQVEIHLERTTRKLRQEYTRGALKLLKFLRDFTFRPSETNLGATSRTRLHLFPWHHFFCTCALQSGYMEASSKNREAIEICSFSSVLVLNG